MHKRMWVASGVCVVAALSLFFVPGFRQAFDLSLFPWKMIFETSESGVMFGHRWPDSELKSLAAAAAEQRDANALAFVATRLSDPEAAARVATDAVALDPALTWVYYVVAVQHPSLPDVREWATTLHNWDPGNAAPYLVTAEAIDIDQVRRGQIRPGIDRTTPEWQAAMAGALEAPRFEDYLARQWDADRDVVRRYGLFDPLVFLSGFPRRRLPTYAAADISRYLDPSRPTALLQELRQSVERQRSDSAIVRYLQENLIWTAPPERFPSGTSRVLQLSGLMIPVFALLLGVGILYRRKFSVIAFMAAAGLLLSSIILYASYWPSSQMFARFIATGSAGQLGELRETVSSFVVPPLGLSRYSLPTLRFYVWVAVTLLGVAALLYIGLRHLRIRSRAAAGI